MGPENLILKKHFYPACLCKGMIKSKKDNFRCQSLVDSLEQIFSSPFPAVHLTAFSHRFTLTVILSVFQNSGCPHLISYSKSGYFSSNSVLPVSRKRYQNVAFRQVLMAVKKKFRMCSWGFHIISKIIVVRTSLIVLLFS